MVRCVMDASWALALARGLARRAPKKKCDRVAALRGARPGARGPSYRWAENGGGTGNFTHANDRFAEL